MKKTLKVFTCDDARGHYPVGFAAVIVAEDATAAEALFKAALVENQLGHQPDGYTLIELDTTIPYAEILVTGMY